MVNDIIVIKYAGVVLCSHGADADFQYLGTQLTVTGNISY